MALAREVLSARRESTLLHTLDPRDTVPGHDGGILAVRAYADVRAVALGEHVEHRREVHVDAEPTQLARLVHALVKRERLVAGRSQREVVGEDRRGPAQHDDATALVIGGHEKSASERRLELLQEPAVLIRRFEVAPVQDQSCGAGVAEQPDVCIGEPGAGQSEYQLFADEGLKIAHNEIIGCGWPPDLDLRQTRTVRRVTPSGCRKRPRGAATYASSLTCKPASPGTVAAHSKGNASLAQRARDRDRRSHPGRRSGRHRSDEVSDVRPSLRQALARKPESGR